MGLAVALTAIENLSVCKLHELHKETLQLGPINVLQILSVLDDVHLASHGGHLLQVLHAGWELGLPLLIILILAAAASLVVVVVVILVPLFAATLIVVLRSIIIVLVLLRLSLSFFILVRLAVALGLVVVVVLSLLPGAARLLVGVVVLELQLAVISLKWRLITSGLPALGALLQTVRFPCVGPWLLLPLRLVILLLGLLIWICLLLLRLWWHLYFVYF